MKRTCRGRGVVAMVVWAFFRTSSADREGETAGDGRLHESGIWIFYTKLALTASRG